MGGSTREGEIELKRRKGRRRKKGKSWWEVFTALVVVWITPFVLSACRENGVLEESIEEKESTKKTEAEEMNEFPQNVEETVRRQTGDQYPTIYR